MIKRIAALFLILTLAVTPFFVGCKRHGDIKLGSTVIFGDSYSTFEGYIPEGYATYYMPGINYTDVTSVEDTWWSLLEGDTDTEFCLIPAIREARFVTRGMTWLIILPFHS